jgi:hypothetical protein
MGKIDCSVRITGFLAPSDTEDMYAVTDETYNRGGYRAVANQEERLLITPDRRKIGMLVKQLSDNTYWSLVNGIENDNWIKENFNQNTGDTNSVSSKISFGNIVTNNFSYPVTLESSINSMFGDRYFKYLKDNYDDYSNFLFNVYCEGGNVFLNKQFKTKDDMISFLNDNLERPNNDENTERYAIECHVNQTSDIGVINKIYAMNLFYSVLKGSGAYKKHVKTLYEGAYIDENINIFKHELIKGVWDYFTFEGFLQPDSYDNAAKSIWFPQTHSNIYNLLNAGNKISFQGISGERHCFNWGDSSFKLHEGSAMEVNRSIIIGMPIGLKSFEMFTDNFHDREYSGSYSYLRVYELKGKDLNDDDITSIFIKPIGQDTFRLNYINNLSEKDLYAIYYEGDNDHQPQVKKITSAIKRDDIVGDISFLIRKNDFNFSPIYGNSSMLRHIGGTKIKKIRFFIGDANGNVSPFSSEITPYVFRNGAKLTTLVSDL